MRSRFKFKGKKPYAFVAVLVFAVFGASLLLASRAATPVNNAIEPEDGTSVSGNASVGVDATASGGKYVSFNSASTSTGTWPASPDAIGARICGNSSILTGPATPPAGAITVPIGDNNSFNFGGTGKTFWFAPGVHTFGTSPNGQIITADNQTYIGAPGAILDGSHINHFAFEGSHWVQDTPTSGHNEPNLNVTIKYLTIRNFTPPQDQGTVNTDSGTNWTISNNTIGPNDDGAGILIGLQDKILYNCMTSNGQYGFSAYHAGNTITDIVFDHNEVTNNNTKRYDVIAPNCGCEGGGKFWAVKRAQVTNNWVHDNIGAGFWADYNNSEFLFENNYIENNWNEGIFYEISYNFMIRYNVLKNNGKVKGKAKDQSFPTGGAIYISESGGDSRAGASYQQAEIHDNYFENNWDGVVLWENADRFCRPGQPNDTTNTCPFFDQTFGTRNKTQNISIHNNEFHFTKAGVGCTDAFCGRQAIFSNFGTNTTYPGTVIQEAITFNQNNHWLNNKYFGTEWTFTAYDTNRQFDKTTWQAAPYNQDAGSTLQ